MKVLITGANGQLGSDLVRILQSHHDVFGFSRLELDITVLASVQEKVRHIVPDIIIHAAAYTNVDQAENDRDMAYLVNTYGTRNVVVAAQQIGAKIVYLSTDYEIGRAHV